MQSEQGLLDFRRAVFLFFIFIFYKNILSFSKFTGIYPGRPGSPCCGAAENFCRKALGGPVARQRGGLPAAGRKAPGGPAARQRGGRLPDTADPHLIHQKFRKKFSVYRNTIRIKDNKKNVTLVCKQWRFPYLQHSELIIRTNQRSLVHLEDQRLHQDDRSIITIEKQVATTNHPYYADLSYVVRVRDL